MQTEYILVENLIDRIHLNYTEKITGFSTLERKFKKFVDELSVTYKTMSLGQLVDNLYILHSLVPLTNSNKELKDSINNIIYYIGMKYDNMPLEIKESYDEMAQRVNESFAEKIEMNEKMEKLVKKEKDDAETIRQLELGLENATTENQTLKTQLHQLTKENSEMGLKYEVIKEMVAR